MYCYCNTSDHDNIEKSLKDVGISVRTPKGKFCPYYKNNSEGVGAVSIQEDQNNSSCNSTIILCDEQTPYNDNKDITLSNEDTTLPHQENADCVKVDNVSKQF